MRKLYYIILFGVFVCLTSCIPHANLVNYQVLESKMAQTSPIQNAKIIRIQSGDVLEIKVHSQDIKTAAPFNLNSQIDNSFINDAELYQLNGYLVDKKGSIDFPILGNLPLGGMSVEEAKKFLLDQLQTYLKDPVVNIRFLNFRVTISGEVNAPGTFTIYNERITLPEVITLAGDLTSYANRRNILIVREIDSKRTFTRVDLQRPNFFTSDYYYLQQNDFIYVEPSEDKRGAVLDNSNKVLPFVSAFVSIAALLISAFK